MKQRVIAFLIVLSALNSYADKPKLVLFLSIDQLRGDYLPEMEDRLGEGGFRYLMDNGAWYTEAQFAHASTYTATGHATLVTGTNAHKHGMVGNQWMDPKTGATIYSVADSDHPLLNTQAAPTSGRSPKRLLAETIGDKLIEASNGKSKVFSLSQKDRSAILMAGQNGKAFWYHSASGRYITSSYYYDEMPPWVKTWNEEKVADEYAGNVWDLLLPESTYRNDDSREIELGNALLGKTFPHTALAEPGRKLYGALIYTPFSDEVALNFARRMIEKENLGSDADTDMLCVSLSTTDIIGHSFGPYSREREDNILRLDKTLASFFKYLDERIGLDNVLITLSADHGADGRPKKKDGSGYIGDIVTPNTIKDVANEATKKAYGKALAKTFYPPYLYMNEDEIKAANLDLLEVERLVAKAISKIEGIGVAIAREDVLSGNFDRTDELMGRVANAVHKDRSCQIVIFQAPYYEIISRRGLFTASHGSPWKYDTHVPVMFAGKDIQAQRIDRPVGPEHIAPTLAALLDIEAPNMADKPALKEVVNP
jgi:predicted AlkP superfamily pyrophosphatase or phosphodiesterase